MKLSAVHLLLIPVLVLFSACQQSEEVEVFETTPSEASAAESEPNLAEALDTDSLKASIDSYRSSIEASLGEAEEMSTQNLRAKLKQKWSKIHFYTDEEGTVIRVKTYPYDGISARTEEFYFDGVDLVLAVIEDDGSAARDQEGEVDKLYYFHDWKVIKEVRANGEGESGYRDSDGEELLAEAREYLKLYAESKS